MGRVDVGMCRAASLLLFFSQSLIACLHCGIDDILVIGSGS